MVYMTQEWFSAPFSQNRITFSLSILLYSSFTTPCNIWGKSVKSNCDHKNLWFTVHVQVLQTLQTNSFIVVIYFTLFDVARSSKSSVCHPMISDCRSKEIIFVWHGWRFLTTLGVLKGWVLWLYYLLQRGDQRRRVGQLFSWLHLSTHSSWWVLYTIIIIIFCTGYWL